MPANRRPKRHAAPSVAAVLNAMTPNEHLATSLWALRVAKEAFEHEPSADERPYYAIEIAALEAFIAALKEQGAKSPRQLELKAKQ